MRKSILLFLSGVILVFQNCTNSTDEQPTPIVITANDFTTTIDENPASGEVLGSIDASINEGTLTFSILDQNPSDALTISDIGILAVNNSDVVDYEVNPVITASISASSAELSKIVTATINLNNLAEGSDGLVFNNFTLSTMGNLQSGDQLGILSASSTVGPVTYSLLSQTPDGAIDLDASLGALRVANAALFDPLVNPSITASVEVTDGVETGAISVTINLEGSLNIWTGDRITFSKSNGSDHNQEANQDRITDNVWITRSNNSGPIFNVQSQANNDDGPGDTEWALGTTSQLDGLIFTSLRDAVGGGRRSFRNIVGQDLVLHLITDDIYIDVRFTQWSSGRQGGFAYERSTEP